MIESNKKRHIDQVVSNMTEYCIENEKKFDDILNIYKFKIRESDILVDIDKIGYIKKETEKAILISIKAEYKNFEKEKMIYKDLQRFRYFYFWTPKKALTNYGSLKCIPFYFLRKKIDEIFCKEYNFLIDRNILMFF